MVRVKISKSRLEQLGYFEKVDAQAQDTDVPNRKNLIVGVEEKNTGNFTIGAGYSSVESIVGFVELKQGNFDLFNPPTFTGAGQKFQMRASVGTQLQDYEINFTEPWFLGQRLIFNVNLFDRTVDYASVNNMYDEAFAGGTLSLTKALGGLVGLGSAGPARHCQLYFGGRPRFHQFPGLTPTATPVSYGAPRRAFANGLTSFRPTFPPIFTTSAAPISFPNSACRSLMTPATI